MARFGNQISRQPDRGRVAGLTERRAEILGMITQLRTRRQGVSRVSRPAPNAFAGVPSALKEPAARKVTSSVALRSKEPAAHDNGEVMLVLQSVEARLARIEDELKKTPPRAPERAGLPKDGTFSGAIQGQMVSDMLQLVSSNQMSGIFVIEDERTHCTLYVEEGRICHAANGDVVGEDAFFAAFGLTSGRYHFEEMATLPAERTISSGTQYLVLEALRRMDESSQG